MLFFLRLPTRADDLGGQSQFGVRESVNVPEIEKDLEATGRILDRGFKGQDLILLPFFIGKIVPVFLIAVIPRA